MKKRKIQLYITDTLKGFKYLQDAINTIVKQDNHQEYLIELNIEIIEQEMDE